MRLIQHRLTPRIMLLLLALPVLAACSSGQPAQTGGFSPTHQMTPSPTLPVVPTTPVTFSTQDHVKLAGSLYGSRSATAIICSHESRGSKVNDPLWNSPADWISPGFDDEIFTGGRHPGEPGGPQSRWLENPPENLGIKVVISDTDHYAAGRGDPLWAWKSFLRGHNPILMDFGIIDVVHPLDPALGVPSYESLEPARYAMGDTLSFAEHMKLIEMLPRSDLSSTSYALANPGQEYLVLQPSGMADSFTVTLEAGTYTVEWFSISSRQTQVGGSVTVESAGNVSFTPTGLPAGPVVLYLNRGGW
jgi:hypothetical protein